MRNFLRSILPYRYRHALKWAIQSRIEKIKYPISRRRALAHLKKMNCLMPEAPPMSVPYTADELAALDRMILDKVRLLQFATPVEDARFLIAVPTSNEAHFAVGASLSFLTRSLRLGYLYGRTVLYDEGHWLYDFCFKPIGIHSLEKAELKAKKHIFFNLRSQQDRTVSFTHDYPSMAWMIESQTRINMRSGLLRLPEINYAAPLNRLPYGYLYMDGLLMDSFLELKEEYKEHIQSRKRDMGFAGPVIGLHVRMGDHETYRDHSIENYLQASARMVSETGIKTVFVTTDSPEFLRQLPRDSGITFIYDEREKRYNNCNVVMVRKNPELRKQETMTAIKNVYLLSECDYIVGAYSNISEYGAALFYHRNRKMNRILMRRREDTGFDLEYLTAGDDKLPASTAPVAPRHDAQRSA